MKKLNAVFAAIIIGSLLFTSACLEEEVIDKTAVLMDTTWINSEFTVNFTTEGISTIDEIDMLNEIDECNKDDELDFTSTTEYRFLDGANTCANSPSEGVLATGTWDLDEDSNTLSLGGDYFETITGSYAGFPVTFSDLTTGDDLLFKIISISEEQVELQLEKDLPITVSTLGTVQGTAIVDITLVPAP